MRIIDLGAPLVVARHIDRRFVLQFHFGRCASNQREWRRQLAGPAITAPAFLVVDYILRYKVRPILVSMTMMLTNPPSESAAIRAARGAVASSFYVRQLEHTMKSCPYCGVRYADEGGRVSCRPASAGGWRMEIKTGAGRETRWACPGLWSSK